MRWPALLLAAALAAPAAANDPLAHGRAARLDVAPLTLEGGAYNGVRLTGAWRLESPDPDFGGLSALLVEGAAALAVSDRGSWVSFGRTGAHLAEPLRLAPIRSERGARFAKDAGDAEGLARRKGTILVSFERDHRIAAHRRDGRLDPPLRAPVFADLEFNGGLEALATLPDGRLLAFAETSATAAFRYFVLHGDQIWERALPRRSKHDITGADMGPDGRLYLLRRHYSFVAGVSVRLDRYRLGPDGLPDPATAETLAAWLSASGIDNMEGISVFRDRADGPIRIWLISDDNFNPLQRTLLLSFDVLK